MEEEVFEGRMESKEQMRRGIMRTHFAKVSAGTVQCPGESWMQEVENLVKKVVQHRQTAEAGVCVVASALAVPSAGNTLPSEPLLDGFSLVRFSSNVPCSTEQLSLATPVEAAWSYSSHFIFSPALTTTCTYLVSFSSCLLPSRWEGQESRGSGGACLHQIPRDQHLSGLQ